MEMTRIFEIAGFAGLAGSVLALCVSLATAGAELNTSAMPQLDAVSATLMKAGLQRRDDVIIEIGGDEVALGFSRGNCDGLLLIAPLPHTAQGWSHIAPRLNMSAFNVQYLYDGALHAQVPRLQRLEDRLLSDLSPGFATTLPRLLAIAEAGDCGLLQSAVDALEAFAQTRPFFGQHPATQSSFTRSLL